MSDIEARRRKAFVDYQLALLTLNQEIERTDELASSPQQRVVHQSATVRCCLTCKNKRISQKIFNVCSRDRLPIRLENLCDHWEPDSEHAVVQGGKEPPVREALPVHQSAVMPMCCPFCGADDSVAKAVMVVSGRIMYHVRCETCQANGPLTSHQSNAIDLWNERTGQQRTQCEAVDGERDAAD